jgi:hypothetical protein
MLRLLSFQRNALFRRSYGDMMIPPNDGKKHLSSSNNVNKSLQPNLKRLSPTVISKSTGDTKLLISHSAIEITPGSYFINLSLDATIQVIKPAIYVCCLDVSGSMDGASTYNDSDSECSKFSRWDLVKHSMNTIVHCLRPVDKLAIVTFSNNATKNMALLDMDANGKKQAMRILDGIRIEGQTNLWDGLNTSLNEMDSILKDNNTNAFTLLLSDGEPNVNPPRGILNEFLRRISKNKLTSTLHTFGYGYGLDSSLLTSLSEYGAGLFAHIPDHTMCNTVFINFLSNSLATAINRVDLKVGNMSGCDSLTNISHPLNDSGIINVGAIQSGQRQNIILASKIIDPDNFSVKFDLEYNNNTTSYTINKLNKNRSSVTSLSTFIFDDNDHKSGSRITREQIEHVLASGDLCYQIPKIWLLNIIKNGMNNYNPKKTCDQLDKFCDVLDAMISTCTNKTDKEKLVDLFKNVKSANQIEGQIQKAFSNDEWFKRWGIHYFKYFIRSHQLQVCSNFKDPSLQHYGGQLFKELRDEVEDIFMTMPVPVASRAPPSQPYSGNFTQSTYQATGPCVDGDGYVKIENGQIKKIYYLKKGDKIINSDGNVATIVCVIKTKVKNGSTSMLSLNQMKVTPFHPIRIDNKWRFPANVGKIRNYNSKYVYNFVLDKHHIMTINGIDIITLGHGIENDPVLKHPFFGTQEVINHLKTHPGWDEGLIELKQYEPKYKNGMIATFW